MANLAPNAAGDKGVVNGKQKHNVALKGEHAPGVAKTGSSQSAPKREAGSRTWEETRKAVTTGITVANQHTSMVQVRRGQCWQCARVWSVAEQLWLASRLSLGTFDQGFSGARDRLPDLAV
jgi:hypothetical protein